MIMIRMSRRMILKETIVYGHERIAAPEEAKAKRFPGIEEGGKIEWAFIDGEMYVKILGR